MCEGGVRAGMGGQLARPTSVAARRCMPQTTLRLSKYVQAALTVRMHLQAWPRQRQQPWPPAAPACAPGTRIAACAPMSSMDRPRA